MRQRLASVACEVGLVGSLTTMGISDRDYYRPADAPAPWSMTTTLIVVNVAVYAIELLFDGRIFGKSLFDWLSLSTDVATQPWRFYGVVSYGFVHDPQLFAHIFFNMLGLWCFGREMEEGYGRREFLRFYLAAIVAGGVAFLLGDWIVGKSGEVFGASAGVLALVVLYIFRFPRRTILLMGVIPMPAWALGVLFLVLDLSGSVGGQTQTAYAAHLGGALFGFVYYRAGLNLERWLGGDWRFWKWRPRPSLRVVDPDDSDHDEKSVDEILAKISQTGEASLTKKERETLERASRRYQRRRGS